MSASHPFNPRLVIGLIVGGILAFAALLLLLAYGPDMAAGREGRAHALSVSAVGFKGLVALVGEYHDTDLIRGAGGLDAEGLVVVAVETRSRPDDVTRLLERRRGLATLVILPKWLTMPDPRRRDWVRSLGPGAGSAAAGLFGKGVAVGVRQNGRVPREAAGEDILSGLRVPVPRSPQVIRGDNLLPLLSLGDGDALVARIGDQPHYVVADPDLLNNHGLSDLDAARAALQMVESLHPPDDNMIYFDLTVNGIGRGDSPSLLQTAFEPPFLAMTLALVAAALLAGLHGAFRFGPARREERAIALGKAALVENSAGLIRLAGREARLGSAYADVVRHDAARTASAPPWLQGDALEAYLDRLSRHGGPKFSELAERLALARDRHGLMAAARSLFQWKKDIIR